VKRERGEEKNEGFSLCMASDL